jgi:Fe-S oxidoreductase
MTLHFAPGCALYLYKPRLAERVLAYLNAGPEPVLEHTTCCHHDPGLPAGSRIVNVCPGCDRRYRELYPGISTVSLWEVLSERGDFPFPDHGGAEMTVLDACPTRTEVRVHQAIRALLGRMNIRVVEAERSGTRSTCCGDSAFGVLPAEGVRLQMARRAQEMPCQDVVVYCVSCVKSMHNGGRRPRHILDLLFGEATEPGVTDPEVWHGEVDAFILAH